MSRAGFLIAAAALLATSARGADYRVKAGEPNRVVFVSKAATETVEGKTDRLDGYVVVDRDSVGDSVTVHLEVDLASLDTGIGKRNKDMRKYLETDKHPKAVFAGATVLGPEGAALEPGRMVAFDCEGDFTVHGVTRRLRVTVEVTARDERTLALKATFKVALADHKIERPKFLFLKLSEVQEVTVEGIAIVAP
jgi:polyisoprenoid-binding protein YceI